VGEGGLEPGFVEFLGDSVAEPGVRCSVWYSYGGKESGSVDLLDGFRRQLWSGGAGGWGRGCCPASRAWVRIDVTAASGDPGERTGKGRSGRAQAAKGVRGIGRAEWRVSCIRLVGLPDDGDSRRGGVVAAGSPRTQAAIEASIVADRGVGQTRWAVWERTYERGVRTPSRENQCEGVGAQSVAREGE